MKTFIELEILAVEEAQGFEGKAPEHKSELIYLQKNKRVYGEEQIFKKLKSMLPVEDHKTGVGRFEVKLVAYSHPKTKRPEISIKILKQVK